MVIRVKRAAPLELQIQSSVKKQLRYVAPAVSMVAIPNAAKRGPAAIRQAKMEGMATGFPDAMFIWDGGLAFIEFKRPGENPNDNQAEWIKRLSRWGHPVTVCRSPEEAFAFLARVGAPISGRIAA